MKPKVFLSYTRRDLSSKVLTRLRRRLQQLPEIELWVDTDRIQEGQDAPEEVERAILETDVFIPVVSEAYSSSHWGSFEAYVALQLRPRRQRQPPMVLPVRIDGSRVPEAFTTFPALDFTKGFSSSFSQLRQLIPLASQAPLGIFDLSESVAAAPPILEVASAVSDRLIAYLTANPDQLKVLDRRLFEELVAELFRVFGYEVELTKRTRDGGRDVVAIQHKVVQVKYLIECKRPDPGHKIGIRPVRELFAVKTDELATKAIFATTAEFTRDAYLFFDRHRWELEPRDHAGLLEWLQHYLRLRTS